MKSVVVHYQEIALKGKNRPWFVARLARNVRQATSDLDVADVRVADGPHRRRARQVRAWDEVSARLSDVFRDRELRPRGAGAARRRRASPRDPRRSGDRQPADVSRVRAPRRQAIPAHLAADRARGRRADQGSQRLARRSRRARADHSRRGADRPKRSTSSARIAAPAVCRSAQRTRRVPAVGRHRLAGCRLAHDAARLPRAVRALSQLSDSVARVAGKGARARAAADAVPVRVAAVPGPVRRDSAAGRADRPAAAACRRLPPADAADRRAHRAATSGAGAGDRRSRRPGRVADAREPHRRSGASPRCRCSGRSSAWTRKRSRSKRSGSGTYPVSIIPDQDCCTLFTPRHPATRARPWDVEAAEAGARHRRHRPARHRRGGSRTLHVPSRSPSRRPQIACRSIYNSRLGQTGLSPFPSWDCGPRIIGGCPLCLRETSRRKPCSHLENWPA